MDSKELRGLFEAYSEVYAPQEKIEEAVKGESSERRQALATERRAGHRPLSKKEGENYASHKLAQIAYVNRKRMGEEVEQIDEISTRLAGNVVNARIAATGAAADRAYKHRNPEAMRAAETAAHKEARAKKLAAGVRARRAANEEFDIFDLVLEFLQVEGYTETLEQAEWMMANVLDEEAIDIILGEGHGSRRSFKTQSKDERWRVNTFGSNYTPHQNYDPEANRGQGQILRPNQAEKKRRKALAKSAMTKEAFNIFVNTLINEGMNLDRYSWDDLHYAFDEIFSESSQANRDPDTYERKQRQSETKGQSAERRVRDRLSTMDPDKRAKMIAQMRAVGLNV